MISFNYAPYVSLNNFEDLNVHDDANYGYNPPWEYNKITIHKNKLYRSGGFIACIVYAVDSFVNTMRIIHLRKNILPHLDLRPRVSRNFTHSEFPVEWISSVDGSKINITLPKRNYNFHQINFINGTLSKYSCEQLNTALQHIILYLGIPFALLDPYKTSFQMNKETNLYGLYSKNLKKLEGLNYTEVFTITGLPIGVYIKPAFLWLSAYLMREILGLERFFENSTIPGLDSFKYEDLLVLIKERNVSELLPIFFLMSEQISKSGYLKSDYDFQYSPYNNNIKPENSKFIYLLATGGLYSQFKSYEDWQKEWWVNSERYYTPHGVSLKSWQTDPFVQQGFIPPKITSELILERSQKAYERFKTAVK